MFPILAIVISALVSISTGAHADAALVASVPSNIGSAESDIDVLRREIDTAQKVQDDKLSEVRQEFQASQLQHAIEQKALSDATHAISERVALIDGINARVDAIKATADQVNDRLTKLETGGSSNSIANGAKITALSQQVSSIVDAGRGADWVLGMLGAIIGGLVGLGSMYAFLRRPRNPLPEPRVE